MVANGNTLGYLRAGVANLLEHGSFRNGRPFRSTQNDALHAYRDYLNRDDITDAEKLSGFFVLPTGTGKTALFLAIVDEAHAVARQKGDKLRTMIVVPTRPLLQQTYDAIAEWAPDYLGKVGRYGDKYKQLGKELSLVIYNSWVTLMEAGKIDSSKIDILVSDEAHRGTSERRLTEKFNAFSNGTAQIAFTATSHFDEEKSVEQSHGNLVFERSLPDAIRLDELAAYIQTQLHIIRIAPREDTTSEERAGMRQEAWIRNMVNIYRDGRDELTGDLLSDNKSGFYVGDTAMADRAAHLLCADPVLQERAKAQGCKGVAVSIHSNMSSKMQDDLLEAFKLGEYMACVSDSKLKEGFDDPTLKNVFDYPRGSLVDKAQIVGRAARKWFNELKGRYEGATIVDTIVYIGSDDPAEDKRLKEDAIRKAVMAWSVLEGTVVFSEKEEELVHKRKSERGGFGSPELGMDVESFVTLEEVQAIHARQQDLLEGDYIPLTNEMRKDLRAKLEASYTSIVDLIRSIESPPDGVNAGKVSQWLSIGHNATQRVKRDEWDIVISAANELNESDYARLTKQMRANLRDIISTIRGKESAAIKIIKDAGLGRCVRSLRSWSDDNSSIYKVLKADWLAVTDALSAKSKIPLTREMKFELKEKIENVGLGATALARKINDSRITESKIKAWSYPHNDTRNVVKSEWDFLNNSLDEFVGSKLDGGNANFNVLPKPSGP